MSFQLRLKLVTKVLEMHSSLAGPEQEANTPFESPPLALKSSITSRPPKLSVPTSPLKDCLEVRLFLNKSPSSTIDMFALLGELIGVRSSSFICLYDWKDCRLIRKIEVAPKAVFWNEAGDQVVISTDTSFYILKYNREVVAQMIEAGTPVPDDGIEDAFDVLHEIPERYLSQSCSSRTICCLG